MHHRFNPQTASRHRLKCSTRIRSPVPLSTFGSYSIIKTSDLQSTQTDSNYRFLSLSDCEATSPTIMISDPASSVRGVHCNENTVNGASWRNHTDDSDIRIVKALTPRNGDHCGQCCAGDDTGRVWHW
ncbi:hypothetical protein PM082_019406 [Marasmius tenuissimus]|nr:hypothetical protein PM082_019406 [Marasmius tenuissimus]